MGSYLSQTLLRPRIPALLGGEQLGSPDSPGPTHSALRGPHAGRVSSLLPVQSVARRMSDEDLPVWSRQRHRRRCVLFHRRLYLFPQARGFFPGSWASSPRGGLVKKLKHATYSTRMLCTAIIFKTAATRGKLLRSALQQTVLCVLASLSGQRSPSSVKASTAATAIQKDAKATPQEVRDLTVPAEGGGEQARQQETPCHPPALVQQETPCHSPALVPSEYEQSLIGASDGSGFGRSSKSAFRRLMFHGALASFVPRPGPLQLPYKQPPGSYRETDPTCYLSGSGRRNSITSSYSSTRGFHAPTLRIWSCPSGHAQGLVKKDGGGVDSVETSLICPSSTPAVVDPVSEEAQKPSPKATCAEAEQPQPPEKNQKDPEGTPQATVDISRSRKRKVCLLRPYRPNEPLILPPAPQPGYPVTSEDLDAEKRAAMEWMNKILEG